MKTLQQAGHAATRRRVNIFRPPRRHRTVQHVGDISTPRWRKGGDIHRKYLFKYKRPERGAEEPNGGEKMRNGGIICFLTILLNL